MGKHHAKGHDRPLNITRERYGIVTYGYEDAPERVHTAQKTLFEPCCAHNSGNCCETVVLAGLCETHRARQVQALREQIVLLRAYLQQQENWLAHWDEDGNQFTHSQAVELPARLP